MESLAAIPGITPGTGGCAGASRVDALEDLLQADVSDLAGMPQIGEQAAAILEAVRAEAARRTLKVGETPVSVSMS